jgi:alpha,alpha-trehalase
MLRAAAIYLSLTMIALTTMARGDTSVVPGNSQLPQLELKELYAAVEQAHLFPDSKTFADAVARSSPDNILIAYRKHIPANNALLREFVLAHFELPPPPSTIAIKPAASIAEHIDALWPSLTRVTKSVPKYSSLLPLPAPYVVPGGRFRELYYWDSYFTMLGLQVSGNSDAVRDMVKNFAYLIDTYGHVPNGTRSYYLSRSQPPFFFAMVKLLSPDQAAKSCAQYLPELKREYAFWMEGADSLTQGAAHRRVVALAGNMVLNRYWDDIALPRDESYAEDTSLAKSSKRDERQLYRDLRAAAESGWDFSSRWLADGRTLSTIETTDIVPVDLNSLLYGLEMAIHDGCEFIADQTCAREFSEHAKRRKAAMNKYLWNESRSAFIDYQWKERRPMPLITAATVYPLFTHVATEPQVRAIAGTVEDQLLKAGGLVTTAVKSGQQWDAPNGWAPIQWLAVKGFNNYQMPIARLIACRWMVAVNHVYAEKGKLVEKYNVLNPIDGAGGGEYPLQDGFGWSNGVMRKLIEMYPEESEFTGVDQCAHLGKLN